MMLPMGFGMDPTHLMITLGGMALIGLAQFWVKSTVNRYKAQPTAQGLSGAQVAEAILRESRIHDVGIEMVAGELSDHYDPGAKMVRLSPEIYHGQSVSGAAIAAHEVGHAIQHATGYVPVTLRASLVPVANIGSNLGPWLIMGGVLLGFGAQGGGQLGLMAAWAGVALFGMSVAFHLVTLPVEIDASMRAMAILNKGRYLSTTELGGAKAVLTAAAMTYVTTALYSLMELLYWVFRILGASRRD